MPLLLLMRHGKSRWDEGPIDDRERSLAPRGVRAARRMGRFLSESGHEPGLVVSSDAVRARETTRLAREEGGWSCETVVDERLYRSGLDGLLTVARDRRNRDEVVLLVGHNPTMALAVSHLTGGCNVRFPTAAVACLELSRESSAVAPGCAELRWLVVPRLLDH